MRAPSFDDWGLVLPIKGGPRAKSRLRDPRRPGVALAVALDTLAVATDVVAAHRVTVVTADPVVRSAALDLAPVLLTRDPGAGLDAAAHAGVRTLHAAGLERVGVLLADHPCLRRAELEAALRAAARHTVAVVPDAHGTGTALLTTTDPAAFTSAFGRGSARAHEALGATRLDLDLPGLRLDVDDLDDLDAALALGLGPRTTAALLGYADGRAGEHPHDE